MNTPLPRLRSLLARLNDLKRIRTADAPTLSLAQRWFARAWSDLAAGDDPGAVAVRETAAALAAVELGGVEPAHLRRGRLDERKIESAFRRAADKAGAALDPTFRAGLTAAVTDYVRATDRVGRTAPDFAARMQAQPRAGVTHPSKPRLVLEPADTHADHCYLVAVLGVVLCSHYGADPAVPFLAGLAHHLHNAILPDAGLAGEELLGSDFAALVERFTAEVRTELPASLAERVKAATGDALPFPDTPAAKAFHAAEVIDRVLDAAHFDRVAQFRVGFAMTDLELVAPGPYRAFQNQVLTAVGLP